MKKKTFIKLLHTPRLVFAVLLKKSARCFKNDRLYLAWLWRCKTGYKLNWHNPKSFCEKIQWLKIYNRNPLYTTLVDKVAVKKYVGDIIGHEHIIKTLGLWNNPEEIDFGSLPNQFVLKTTHGGGGKDVVICKDKSTFDSKSAICVLKKAMKKDIYVDYREWPYKDVPHRIIAEEYLSDYKSNSSSDLIDYKFFCFNGEPLYCQVIKDRSTKETIDFYDMAWVHQEFVGLNPGVTHSPFCLNQPSGFEMMKSIAKILSKDLPFVRIDMYEVGGHVFFGEITLFPASGFGRFTPDIYDELLGRRIQLPNL